MSIGTQKTPSSPFGRKAAGGSGPILGTAAQNDSFPSGTKGSLAPWGQVTLHQSKGMRSDQTAKLRAAVSQTTPFRKPRPTIQTNSGMQLPNGASWGNGIPFWGAEMGCRFPMRPLGETASQNSGSKRDVVSQTGLLRKMHPGIPVRNGTRFPSRGPMGNCNPPSRAKQGCSFRAGHQKTKLRWNSSRLGVVEALNRNYFTASY